MNRKGLFLSAFLLMLYIGPMIFVSSHGHTTTPAYPNLVKDFSPSAGEGWFDEDWAYRRNVTITGSAGAGTNYQVPINVSYDPHMQTDFDDVLFTDAGGITPLGYWRETYTASTIARFWVNVSASLETSAMIYMYYGNGDVSTTSSGFNTFQAFYDKTSITGWTVSDLTVTTSGEYLRFWNPTAGNAGSGYRTDITTSADFQYMARYKTESLGAADSGTTIIMDGSTAARFSQSMTPIAVAQDEWHYYDGATKAGGAWVEGTEFIFTMQIDEGDAVNGIDYRRYDTSWVLQDFVLSENFALGAPADCDGFSIGDMSGAGTIDAYFRWIAFRKCIDTEPAFDSFGDEESYDTHPRWHIIGTATFWFSVLFDMWGFDTGLIILGLVMIPVSMLYLAYGVKHDRSSDRLFYGLIIFFLGVGLFIGGVLP